MNKTIVSLFMAVTVLLGGCTKNTAEPILTPSASSPDTDASIDSPVPGTATQMKSDAAGVQTVKDPDSTTVLVNKHFALPADYKPKDMVFPDVPFLFKEKIEKREMRQEAAHALEALFAAAKQDGIRLAGVSAYRSFTTQKVLFAHYAEQSGKANAITYSAAPGTSEHETGLAIDLSGSDGKCAAQDCFADTKEAAWLAANAPAYGYIIRYPKGKESITGYQYEPWHIRYVGTKVSKEIASKGLTLEEYLKQE
ncbi:M15 family metallopeptidase [Paenibacillus tyrfis]